MCGEMKGRTHRNYSAGNQKNRTIRRSVVSLRENENRGKAESAFWFLWQQQLPIKRESDFNGGHEDSRSVRSWADLLCLSSSEVKQRATSTQQVRGETVSFI